MAVFQQVLPEIIEFFKYLFCTIFRGMQDYYIPQAFGVLCMYLLFTMAIKVYFHSNIHMQIYYYIKVTHPISKLFTIA